MDLITRYVFQRHRIRTKQQIADDFAGHTAHND
jgi:hypothetical protein